MGRVQISNFTKTDKSNSKYLMLYIFHDHLWPTTCNDAF